MTTSYSQHSGRLSLSRSQEILAPLYVSKIACFARGSMHPTEADADADSEFRSTVKTAWL